MGAFMVQWTLFSDGNIGIQLILLVRFTTFYHFTYHGKGDKRAVHYEMMLRRPRQI